MNIKFLLLLVCSMSAFVGFSQEQEDEKKHFFAFAFAFGYTYIPKGAEVEGTVADGVFVPAIGVDYFYRIKPRWEIGVMADMEFGEYIVAERDLNRKNAIIVAIIGAYALTESINIYAGGGMEFERSHNLAVFRCGGEYSFAMGNDFFIAPGFFFDFKEDYDTWSLAVALGKEF